MPSVLSLNKKGIEFNICEYNIQLNFFGYQDDLGMTWCKFVDKYQCAKQHGTVHCLIFGQWRS